MPIQVMVPASYKPKTGANPWLEAGDAACTELQAVCSLQHADSRASLAAVAAMWAPPPNPAPPPRLGDGVELAAMSTTMRGATSVDLDSPQRLPRPRPFRSRKRSADATDEMRMFDTPGTRDQPPTHRQSGRVTIRERADSASQEFGTPLSRIPVVGRARGNSLVGDPTAAWLTMSLQSVITKRRLPGSSASAASNDPGAASAGGASLNA